MAAPISRQRMPCSIQNLRMAGSGWVSVNAADDLGMGEVGRVEVQADLDRLGPGDPVLELVGAQRVAVHLLAAHLGVAGVEVEAVAAGDERERLLEVAAQLVWRCGPCRDNCR